MGIMLACGIMVDCLVILLNFLGLKNQNLVGCVFYENITLLQVEL